MELVANVETTVPAKFRVKLNKIPYVYDKSIIDYMTLTIGSKTHSCVDITIPLRDKSEPLYLSHITASKPGAPCSIDNTIIKGPKTKQMFYFAASLLSKLTDKTLIEFTDQSQYPCNITPSEIRNMPLNVSYFMFHGKTWYDELFGAKPKDVDIKQIYEQLKSRRKDATFKPKNFNFKTPPLNEALTPLYEKTATWEDFFKKIETAYGNSKCKMIYMWLADAIMTLTKGGIDIFGFQTWTIDIRNMPHVYHTPLKVYGGSARRKTRKSEKELTMPLRDMIPKSADFEIYSNPANIPSKGHVPL